MDSSSTSSSPSQEVNRQSWPPRLYLAVDCGGTKAAAAICDERGDLVGRGQGGPSNYTDNGLLPFLASVEEAVKTALDDARCRFANAKTFRFEWKPSSHRGISSTDGVFDDDESKATQSAYTIADALASLKPPNIPHEAPLPHFEAAWLGIAGVDSPLDVTTLSPHIGTLLSIPCPSQRLIVANDTSLLASPIADSQRPEIKSGVVAIAGTGSIVMSFRRKRNGMLKVLGRVGGFGWLLGDEGSGYSVGRTAVRQVLDLADRERLSSEASNHGTESDEDESDEDALANMDINDRSDAANQGKKKEEKKIRERSFEEDTASSYEKDVAMRMSSGLSHDQAKGDNSHSADGSSTEQHQQQQEALLKLPYGHLLRDRILQHWGLLSTDELLRAVYFDDALPRAIESTIPGVPGPNIITEDHDRLSRSDGTLRQSLADPPSPPPSAGGLSSTSGKRALLANAKAGHTQNLPLPADEASASLLPPGAPKLDVETRLRGVSPIPSLSSSPTRSASGLSDVGGTAVVGGITALMHSNGSTAGTQGTISTYRSQSDSALHTELTSAASSYSATGGSHPRATVERKHRLAALAPLVFHLAFTHEDEMSLTILRTQAGFVAQQIREILKPDRQAKAHLEPRTSVLCLGGSLVGVQRYRDLLVEQLHLLGIDFARVEFVADAARRGALALAHVIERSRS